MRQNGHAVDFTGRYDQTRVDYARSPAKPVVDGEPVYEDHPVAFKPNDFGHSISADVRRALYWDVFAGACGHTYGHHSVWQMWTADRKPVNNPLMDWKTAIQQPGAAQMQHAKNLLLSRPYLTRIPDDGVLVSTSIPSAMPGTGRYRFTATRDSEGRYAMVYAPAGRTFAVHMDVIKTSPVKAWWFNPRNGSAQPIGEFLNHGQRSFISPDPGEHLDWVLVLDAVKEGYPPPGQSTQAR